MSSSQQSNRQLIQRRRDDDEKERRRTTTTRCREGEPTTTTRCREGETTSGKTEGGYMVKPEASGAQVDASIVKFQILGPGSNALNANASEQLESQVSSAAISPADLHRFVFAAIEEEMAGFILPGFYHC
ncbi:Mic1 domain-containing protein [Abeliophyllum distichum]|uniref:Mic1 domain-containing protein n=1 Tax=Abeliophyllum distichum TaxID=126358 RepID=A0ABD1UQ87_9LAMI